MSSDDEPKIDIAHELSSCLTTGSPT